MKLLGSKQLSVLLIGTLLFCHGIFGALHLVCFSPQCAGDLEHPAEHQTAAVVVGHSHEHPADHGTSHGTSAEYFAVLVFSFIGLLMALLPKGTLVQNRLDARSAAVLHRVPAVLRPPLTPTPPSLQVFRL
jgi:hypothetical protein